MARSRKSSREMFPVIEAYLESGLTQKAFCAEHGLSAPVFAYWLAKYRRDQSGDTSGAFVEITPNRPPVDLAHMEIEYPSGIRLRLFASVPPSYVRQLLAS